MTFSSHSATLVASFRDATEPRPLASRLIASAHQHAYGWTVQLAAGRRIECLTFDAAADEVIRTTGVDNLLIVWLRRTADVTYR